MAESGMVGLTVVVDSLAVGRTGSVVSVAAEGAWYDGGVSGGVVGWLVWGV